MKLNSLGPFKRKRRLKKFLTVLCAISAGLLFASEARFAVSRVRLISQEPEVIPQHVLWGTIPAAQERFWPLFWINRKEYIARIESYYPLEAKVRLRGWGKFLVRTRALVPTNRIRWGGRNWYLSADGKFWLASLAENSMIDRRAVDRTPLILWGAERAAPIDMADLYGNIFHSTLPTAQILRWNEQLRSLNILPHLQYMQAGVKDGRAVVNLILYNAESGKSGAQILLPEDVDSWGGFLFAIREIYGTLEKIPPGATIDCTYKDKMVLRGTGAEK